MFRADRLNRPHPHPFLRHWWLRIRDGLALDTSLPEPAVKLPFCTVFKPRNMFSRNYMWHNMPRPWHNMPRPWHVAILTEGLGHTDHRHWLSMRQPPVTATDPSCTDVSQPLVRDVAARRSALPGNGNPSSGVLHRLRMMKKLPRQKNVTSSSPMLTPSLSLASQSSNGTQFA